MPTPEDFVLQHGRVPYDPVKRREYYLRTRQLKGRKTGTASAPAVTRMRKARAVGATPNHRVLNQKQRRAQRRKEVEHRVAALNIRLRKLREVLRDLVEDAQRRSGVNPADSAPAKQSKQATPTGSKKKTEPRTQTTADKKKSAERSKEYYEKTKKVTGPVMDKLLSVKENQLKKEVTVLEQKIMKARKALKQSVAKARQDSSKTKPADKRRLPS